MYELSIKIFKLIKYDKHVSKSWILIIIYQLKIKLVNLNYNKNN